MLQRRQAGANLQPGGGEQRQAEQGEVGQHVGTESLLCLEQVGAVDRHRHAQAPRPGLGEHDHLLLAHQQGLTAGAGLFVVMHDAQRQFVIGQRHHAVPQRARAQPLLVNIVLNLPVKAAQWLFETRIGKRLGKTKAGQLIGLDVADQLGDVGFQLLIELALDMVPKQRLQADAREHQRQGDGNKSGDQQADAQRVELHACSGFSMM